MKFLLSCISVLLLLVVLAFCMSSESTAQNKAAAPQTIKARRIEIVDAKGRTVLLLGTDKQGNGLIEVGDSRGQPVVIIASVEEDITFTNGVPALFESGCVQTRQNVYTRGIAPEYENLARLGGPR